MHLNAKQNVRQIEEREQIDVFLETFPCPDSELGNFGALDICLFLAQGVWKLRRGKSHN